MHAKRDARWELHAAGSGGEQRGAEVVKLEADIEKCLGTAAQSAKKKTEGRRAPERRIATQ
jgi:hypothetical protein